MNGIHELKSHPFFKGIDFEKLSQKEVQVPCPEVFAIISKNLGTEMDEFDSFSIKDPIFNSLGSPNILQSGTSTSD